MKNVTAEHYKLDIDCETQIARHTNVLNENSERLRQELCNGIELYAKFKKCHEW